EDLGQVEDGSTESVVPGFLAHRPRPSPSGGLGGPLGLGILIAALALFSGAGLWQLQRSLRKEAEAARVRSEFLTMVTHELKTPLAGIRLLAEMLEDGHLEPGQLAGYHTRLSSESRRLGMLIENVLDLGRMERGERGFDFRPLELDGLLREARGLYGPIAERSRLEMSVSQGAARVIQGDRDALLQSLRNVMDNARKYAACGGRLDLRSAANGERCRILVRDYGPGIRAEERSAVFERFRRGSRHQDGSIPGVGLGLHLARSILRSHGGDLVAQSPADGGPGACFCFTLPAAPPVQPDETVEEL
ncbi:MAG: sensor histidine kinase, partial [Planctomycetota bacterium]